MAQGRKATRKNSFLLETGIFSASRFFVVYLFLAHPFSIIHPFTFLILLLFTSQNILPQTCPLDYFFCIFLAIWANPGFFTTKLEFKECLRLFFVALMMKLALGSNNVPGSMHISISQGKLKKAQTVQGLPKSFPVGCDA